MKKTQPLLTILFVTAIFSSLALADTFQCDPTVTPEFNSPPSSDSRQETGTLIAQVKHFNSESEGIDSEAQIARAQTVAAKLAEYGTDNYQCSMVIKTTSASSASKQSDPESPLSQDTLAILNDMEQGLHEYSIIIPASNNYPFEVKAIRLSDVEDSARALLDRLPRDIDGFPENAAGGAGANAGLTLFTMAGISSVAYYFSGSDVDMPITVVLAYIAGAIPRFAKPNFGTAKDLLQRLWIASATFIAVQQGVATLVTDTFGGSEAEVGADAEMTDITFDSFLLQEGMAGFKDNMDAKTIFTYFTGLLTTAIQGLGNNKITVESLLKGHQSLRRPTYLQAGKAGAGAVGATVLYALGQVINTPSLLVAAQGVFNHQLYQYSGKPLSKLLYPNLCAKYTAEQDIFERTCYYTKRSILDFPGYITALALTFYPVYSRLTRE